MKIGAKYLRAAITQALSFGKVRLGKGTALDSGAVLSVRGNGRISLGKRCRIRRGTILNADGGNISIGDNCTINPYAVLYGNKSLTIGSDVRIASHVVIVPSNHVFSDLTRPIAQQGYSFKGIVIEDDVWIGANCTVLDGAHIGRGCVIAAGSVVRGKLEPNCVYGGVPCKLLKRRGD